MSASRSKSSGSASAAVSAGIGGKGGTGANAATVALTSTGTNITTSGGHSYGILAQSIGGGGEAAGNRDAELAEMANHFA